MNFKPAPLPKPYSVGSNIAHLEHVRPLGQAVGFALDKASRTEGGPANPLTTDPRGNPSVLHRLRIGLDKAPAIHVNAPKMYSGLKTPKI